MTLGASFDPSLTLPKVYLAEHFLAPNQRREMAGRYNKQNLTLRSDVFSTVSEPDNTEVIFTRILL